MAVQPVLISYRRNSRFNPGGPCRPQRALTYFSFAPIAHSECLLHCTSRKNLRFVGLQDLCTVFLAGSLFTVSPLFVSEARSSSMWHESSRLV